MAKNNTDEIKITGEIQVGKAEETPATMAVPVDQMQAVLDQLEEQKRQIEVLNSIQSSTRLQEAEEKQGADNRPRVHFKKIDGKTIIGWPDGLGEEKKSEVIFNPATNMPVGEILKCVYYYADGTKSDLIDQMKVTKSNELTYARVVEDDGDYGLLEFEDKSVSEKPLRIHKKYWNA